MEGRVPYFLQSSKVLTLVHCDESHVDAAPRETTGKTIKNTIKGTQSNKASFPNFNCSGPKHIKYV